MMKGTCAVILADKDITAENTLKSRYAAEVLFRPAVLWVLEACKSSGAERVGVIAGGDPGGVLPLLPADCITGALEDFLADEAFPNVVLVRGDLPLIEPAEIAAALKNGVRELMPEGDSALAPISCEALAVINEKARRRIIKKLWQNGVNIPFEDGVIIGPEVTVGAGTAILPGTILRGKTAVGKDCEIGPSSYLNNAAVGDGCRVISTMIDSSVIEDGVRIGPMSNVRPNCRVCSGAKIGDFVELKNSTVGERTSVAHLTYVGDSDVGSGCNFGCGVVTVNYDGSKKYRTVIGDDAFIGCNTNLIAPVKVGDRAYTAAGSTITDDVPPDTLAIGRARQINKADWSKQRGLYNKKK